MWVFKITDFSVALWWILEEIRTGPSHDYLTLDYLTLKLFKVQEKSNDIGVKNELVYTTWTI